MANRYCNLVGTNKIKDEYTKINDGFDAVERDMDAAQSTANAALPKSGGTLTGSLTVPASATGGTQGVFGKSGETEIWAIVRSGNDTDVRTYGKLKNNGNEVITSAGGQTFNASMTISSTSPALRLFDTDSNNSVWLLHDSNSFYLQLRDANGNWVRDLLRIADDGSRAEFAGAGPFYRGSGSPEGVVTAPVGSIYQRTDGGASTTLYVKESGTGNTGWKAVQTA